MCGGNCVGRRFISEDFFKTRQIKIKKEENHNIIERSRITKKIFKARIKKRRNFSEVYCVTVFNLSKQIVLEFSQLSNYVTKIFHKYYSLCQKSNNLPPGFFYAYD